MIILRFYKNLITFVLVILFLRSFSYAALGDQTDPAESCLEIHNISPTSPSDLYRIQTPSMPTPKQFYCEMNEGGGGWMLIAQRRHGNFNRENCGTNLNDFLHQDCGQVTNLGATKSYSANIDEIVQHHSIDGYMVLDYSLVGTLDTNDSFILDTTKNIFPNSTSLHNIPIDGVCSIDYIQCDNTDVYWKYIGDSWFSSAQCSSNADGALTYHGNFGYCHDGLGGYDANSLLGTRDGYNSTKLWGYGALSRNYYERIFIRQGEYPPTDISLDNQTYDGSLGVPGLVGILSTVDNTSNDSHTYSIVPGQDSGSFTISGNQLFVISLTKPTYYLSIQTTDESGLSYREDFTITITGMNRPGTSTDPITSCQAVNASHPTLGSGVYRMQDSDMSSPVQIYCDQETQGGGWMLLFQRRGGYTNTEACGTHLNEFLHQPCGDVNNLLYGDSYSADVDDTIASFGPTEYLFTQQNSAGTISQDSFTIDSPTSLFPNDATKLHIIPYLRICDINGQNCDSDDGNRLYAGTSWFNSSRCNGGYNGSTNYKGNYGYCHKPFTPQYTSNSLYGTREGYDEAKLWGHNNGAKNYMERVYIRKEYTPPVGEVRISAPSSLSGTLTTKNTPQIFEGQFIGYFGVQDARGSSDGRYTTIAISDLVGPETIRASDIAFRTGPITILSGSSNPEVSLGTASGASYEIGTPITLLQRSSGTTPNIYGSYGVESWLRIPIPAYITPGEYHGDVTYTLYEN